MARGWGDQRVSSPSGAQRPTWPCTLTESQGRARWARGPPGPACLRSSRYLAYPGQSPIRHRADGCPRRPSENHPTPFRSFRTGDSTDGCPPPYIPTCPTIHTDYSIGTAPPWQAARAPTSRAVMSAVVIAVASFLSGTIGGWWLTMVVVTASISFSQERMERKVRYWQAETARAEAEAERLARVVIASSRKAQRPGGDWPHAH